LAATSFRFAFESQEAAMRLAYVFLLLHLFTASAFAQSLTIDKLDRKNFKEAPREVSYSSLLEGTIDNPNLVINVFVYESGNPVPRAFGASVDATRVDSAGGYRWRAVCYFGDFGGKSVGQTYQVRVVAMDPNKIRDTADILSATSAQTDAIELKRVRN
jgi:hypothetical protein